LITEPEVSTPLKPKITSKQELEPVLSTFHTHTHENKNLMVVVVVVMMMMMIMMTTTTTTVTTTTTTTTTNSLQYRAVLGTKFIIREVLQSEN
jgi:hypothetical protein